MAIVRDDLEQLSGVERRAGAEPFTFREIRATKDAPAQIIVEGYAATFTPYDVAGGPDATGGWREQLSTRAFDKTLASKPDLHLLVNHTGLPLARTKSGTLALKADDRGLRFKASLDPEDIDAKSIIRKIARGDVDQCSFGFNVNEQEWNSDYSHRTINALSLHKGDISIVNWGANENTKVVIADAVGALSRLSSKELVELRKLDQAQAKRAAAVLASIGAHQSFGDPGYKADRKKRYPLSTENLCRSGWAYINMPKNQSGYTADQVAAIRGRIEAAAAGFGVSFGEGAKSLSPELETLRSSGVLAELERDRRAAAVELVDRQLAEERAAREKELDAVLRRHGRIA